MTRQTMHHVKRWMSFVCFKGKEEKKAITETSSAYWMYECG
jgi:hypothetical protein